MERMPDEEKEYYLLVKKVFRICFDVSCVFKKSGIEIKEKFPVLLGAGRILKGVNLKVNP